MGIISLFAGALPWPYGFSEWVVVRCRVAFFQGGEVAAGLRWVVEIERDFAAQFEDEGDWRDQKVVDAGEQEVVETEADWPGE